MNICEYLIKDLGFGYGVFKKLIDKKIILEDNMLIQIGEEDCIIANIIYNELKFSIFGGTKNGEVYDFY